MEKSILVQLIVAVVIGNYLTGLSLKFYDAIYKLIDKVWSDK